MARVEETIAEREEADAAHAAAPSPDGMSGPSSSPEMRAKLAELRGRVQLHVGQAVLAMMNLPRYRSQTLGDLAHLVIEPLLRDRLAIASARRKDNEDGEAATAGIAIWASVSEEVDVKIRAQIKDGAFPVRLGPEDWTSGKKPWLLDVIAPDRRLATAVVANFKKIIGDEPFAMHPIVARAVEPGALTKSIAENAVSISPKQ